MLTEPKAASLSERGRNVLVRYYPSGETPQREHDDGADDYACIDEIVALFVARLRAEAERAFEDEGELLLALADELEKRDG